MGLSSQRANCTNKGPFDLDAISWGILLGSLVELETVLWTILIGSLIELEMVLCLLESQLEGVFQTNGLSDVEMLIFVESKAKFKGTSDLFYELPLGKCNIKTWQ